MLRKNIFRGDALLGGIRQLVVVGGAVACSVALGSRYEDGSIVTHRRQENASFPRELLFQQEAGQQGWECLEEELNQVSLGRCLRGCKENSAAQHTRNEGWLVKDKVGGVEGRGRSFECELVSIASASASFMWTAG